jgi:uncharacterized protein YjbJ (UPF0337 family)
MRLNPVERLQLAEAKSGEITAICHQPLSRANVPIGQERNQSARRFRVTMTRRKSMDWNRVEGNWKQVKGKVKEKWGKLTDDDLDVINGRRDQLEGKIQERYGIAMDQIRKDIDAWYAAQDW